MRKLMRAAIVAVAVVFAVAVVPALAQKEKPGAVQQTWTVITLQQLPRAVKAGLRKSFPAAKVTKVEVSGTGKDKLYRLTLIGTQREAIFTPAGKLVNAKKK